MSDDSRKLLDRLVSLLSDITGAPPNGLGLDSTPENTRGWDSVANLNFVASVEEEFGVSIPTGIVLQLRSLRDVLEYLQRHGAPSLRSPSSAPGAAAAGSSR